MAASLLEMEVFSIYISYSLDVFYDINFGAELSVLLPRPLVSHRCGNVCIYLSNDFSMNRTQFVSPEFNNLRLNSRLTYFLFKLELLDCEISMLH